MKSTPQILEVLTEVSLLWLIVLEQQKKAVLEGWKQSIERGT